jgi:hypothetical protein
MRHCGNVAFFMSSVGLIYNVYAISLDLRSLHVLEMWNDLLRGCQTLFRNWVVTKVAFGFVTKHAARHDRSRWDLPLHATGEISLGLSSDRVRKCMAMLWLKS